METTQPPLQISDESITPDFMENEININNTVTRQRRNIFGKVVSKKNEPIYLVEVKNLSSSSDNTTYTNSNGEFIIFASPEDNVRISKERFGSKTIKLTMNENYTLEKRYPYLLIILGIIGFIYLVITFTFMGIGANLRKKMKGSDKEKNKYKRNTLLAFIILSLPFIPFQPVFLVVLIVLCALYHKELKEDNNQIPIAVPVINGQNQNRQRQNGQSHKIQNKIGQRQNLRKQNYEKKNVQRNIINRNLVRKNQYGNIPFATSVEGINNNTSGIPYGEVVNNSSNLLNNKRQNINNPNIKLG